MWYLNCKCGTANVVPKLQMCQTAFVWAAYGVNSRCNELQMCSCYCIQLLLFQLQMLELQMLLTAKDKNSILYNCINGAANVELQK